MKRAPLDPVDGEVFDIVNRNGQRFLIGARQDVIEVLPSGERRYVRHMTLVPAADGRVIDPELVPVQYASKSFGMS